MKPLLARLQEPSTYAGLSALLALAGLNVPDAQYQSVTHAVAAVAGVLAMFLKENAPANPSINP